MSKDISQDSMDKLFGHFGERENVPSEKPEEENISQASPVVEQNKKKSGKGLARSVSVKICTELEQELYEKVRTIADTEGLSVRSIIEYAVSTCVSHYEDTHGKIRIRHKKKGQVGEVFR